MKRRIITIKDYEWLMSQRYYASLRTKTPEILEQFFGELMDAQFIDQSQTPEHVITMNSRVLLKEIKLGKHIELGISYPHESNDLERKVSVFSPIGIALFGRLVGDEVSWKIQGRSGEFEILEVTFQPEAVGQ